MNISTIFGEKSIEMDQVFLGRENWPEFMQHDPIVEKHWASLYSEFLPFQFAIYSENVTVGIGNSVPIHFDDAFINLPSRGLDWAMEKAIDDTANNRVPNLLVGVQILINPELRDTRLSYRFLDLMKQAGITHGINHIALPVRPTQKQLYPLIEMEEYINWINQKGEPFDPWIRVHVKAGGKIVSICSESMTIRGTIKEWQEWTGLNFQSSGLYTVENALCPINIDLEKNIGAYIEPNVWIVHST